MQHPITSIRQSRSTTCDAPRPCSPPTPEAPLIRRSVVGVLTGCLAGCHGIGLGSGIAGGASTQTPSGYAYITSADSQGRANPGAIVAFAIASDGSLSPLSTASIPTGVAPTAICADPSSRFIYVANSGDGSLSQYAIGSGGALSPLSPGSISLPGAISALGAGLVLSIDPAGQTLYVVSNPTVESSATIIDRFSIGTDGRLSPISATPVIVPGAASGPLLFDQAGQSAYLPINSGSAIGQILEFSVGSGGVLTPRTPAGIGAQGTIISLAAAPNAAAIYALSQCIDTACEGEVAQYAVGSDGTLTPTTASIITPDHVDPRALVFYASDAYLLSNSVSIDAASGTVYAYTVDASGAFIPLAPAPISLASPVVSEALYGSELYILRTNSPPTAIPATGGFVDRYAIESNGSLNPLGTNAVTGGQVTALAVVAGG